MIWYTQKLQGWIWQPSSQTWLPSWPPWTRVSTYKHVRRIPFLWWICQWRFPGINPLRSSGPTPCLLHGRGPQPYRVPGMPRMPPPGFGPAPFIAPQMQQHQQPFSNMVKHHANWNVCYSCGFDVADGHTSMSCPAHL